MFHIKVSVLRGQLAIKSYLHEQSIVSTYQRGMCSEDPEIEYHLCEAALLGDWRDHYLMD